MLTALSSLNPVITMIWLGFPSAIHPTLLIPFADPINARPESFTGVMTVLEEIEVILNVPLSIISLTFEVIYDCKEVLLILLAAGS